MCYKLCNKRYKLCNKISYRKVKNIKERGKICSLWVKSWAVFKTPACASNGKINKATIIRAFCKMPLLHSAISNPRKETIGFLSRFSIAKCFARL